MFISTPLRNGSYEFTILTFNWLQSYYTTKFSSQILSYVQTKADPFFVDWLVLLWYLPEELEKDLLVLFWNSYSGVVDFKLDISNWIAGFTLAVDNSPVVLFYTASAAILTVI